MRLLRAVSVLSLSRLTPMPQGVSSRARSRTAHNLLIVHTFVALLPLCRHVHADDVKAFWQKGAATTITGKVQETSSERIVFRDYPIVVDHLKQLQKSEEEARAIMAKARLAAEAQKAGEQFAVPQQPPAAQPSEQPPPPQQPGDQSQQPKSLSRDEILKKYGAPEEPRPIKAKADAPVEMQALFDSINSGDTELAWQYALAMARRNQATQEMVAKATDYQLLAMEAAGMRAEENPAGDGADINPNRLELKGLIEKTKRERLAKKLDPNLPVAAQVGAADDLTDTTTPPANRQTTTPGNPQIPVDPAGRVKLVIFFDEKSADAKEFAKTIRPLREQFKADSNVTILGATRWSYPIQSLQWLSAELNFPFGMTSGEALSRELKIHEYPTYLFIAQSSKDTYRVVGSHGVEEVSKVIQQMKGGR